MSRSWSGTVLGLVMMVAPVLAPVAGFANGGWTSLSSSWSEDGGASIAAVTSPVSQRRWGGGSSFDERSRPSQPAPDVRAWTRPKSGSNLAGLREVISLAESKRDRYNALHHAARRLPSKRPVDLTLGEIFAWIKATPGQHHAIGFYQIIPDTLGRLVAKAGLPLGTRFDKRTQDRLGDILIAEAGYAAFIAGRKSPDAFMDALAKIWAGLPMANDRSAYHGFAGNRATITRGFFEAELRRVFELRQGAS